MIDTTIIKTNVLIEIPGYTILELDLLKYFREHNIILCYEDHAKGKYERITTENTIPVSVQYEKRFKDKKRFR